MHPLCTHSCTQAYVYVLSEHMPYVVLPYAMACMRVCVLYAMQVVDVKGRTKAQFLHAKLPALSALQLTSRVRVLHGTECLKASYV